ncbi:hypothetical protein IT779_36630, partial [Nocardia sp. NEAU-351]|nr:hypothetical protein [Nocardia bovistercoris]
LDLARLRRHIADTLSDNHVPTTIDIRAELPVVGPGKPDRVRLRADVRAASSTPAAKV